MTADASRRARVGVEPGDDGGRPTDRTALISRDVSSIVIILMKCLCLLVVHPDNSNRARDKRGRRGRGEEKKFAHAKRVQSTAVAAARYVRLM